MSVTLLADDEHSVVKWIEYQQQTRNWHMEDEQTGSWYLYSWRVGVESRLLRGGHVEYFD